MTFAAEFDRIGAEHRRAIEQLRRRMEAVNLQTTTRSRDLAAQACGTAPVRVFRGRPGSARILRHANAEQPGADSSGEPCTEVSDDEYYRPRSWLI